MQYIPMIEKKNAFELFFVDMFPRFRAPNLFFENGKLTALGVLVCISVMSSLVRGFFCKKNDKERIKT